MGDIELHEKTWKLHPFYEVSYMLAKHHKVRMVKPARHSVLVTFLNRRQWDSLEQFVGYRAGAINMSLRDTDNNNKKVKDVSSVMAFRRFDITSKDISHECSHASSDFVTNIRIAKNKMSMANMEEVRSYCTGFLVQEVLDLVRVNRIRTR